MAHYLTSCACHPAALAALVAAQSVPADCILGHCRADDGAQIALVHLILRGGEFSARDGTLQGPRGSFDLGVDTCLEQFPLEHWVDLPVGVVGRLLAWVLQRAPVPATDIAHGDLSSCVCV